jgi:hypothetical protein
MKFSPWVLAGILSGVSGHAQVPEIYSIDPPTARAGEVVAFRGQDFHPVAASNIVHFGGVRGRVLEGSVTQLKVEVPRGVQAGPVTVATDGFIAFGPGIFLPRFAPFGTDVIYSRRPVALPDLGFSLPTSADLDGDGDAELIGTSRNGGIAGYVYKGRGVLIGTNSFRQVFELLAPAQMSSPITFDYDADGRVDILAMAPDAVLYFFRNVHESGELSTNSFSRPVRHQPFIAASAVHMADLDRDGRADFVTLSPSGVTLFRNNYYPAVTNSLVDSLRVRLVPAETQGVPAAVSTGDLNQDGHSEIAVLRTNEVIIFSHSDRPGRLTADSFSRVSLPVTNVSWMEIQDIQGDGFADILMYDRISGAFSIYWNRSEGGQLTPQGFRYVPLLLKVPGLVQPQVRDINGDALPDISTGVSTYSRNESATVGNVIFWGSFAPMTKGITIQSFGLTFQADLNGDGVPELISGESVLQNMTAIVPTIAGVSRSGFGGGLELEIWGRPGTTAVLERSSDLNSWMALPSVVIGSSGEAWFEPPPRNLDFFRIKPGQ